ncbi:sushi, von Willebrand factor type A, EGF and pentraxin domain-containing protein 1-like [Mya arenaria]|uniref:sushi, von Willebrand factor type A, EGF and pentraxin domain-containing protein 1-like n=1 Tax=Mya arenaria TaxID=6604 RepID=UPI0022E57D96|nr:sushi, von Willebrand factor type A, EGF and pentraxin domain-containing protein 1-like [Mya arenaria]
MGCTFVNINWVYKYDMCTEDYADASNLHIVPECPVIANTSSYTVNLPEERQPGTVLTFACHLGTVNTSGNLSRTCLNATVPDWSGDIPVCSPVTCANPSTQLNTDFSLIPPLTAPVYGTMAIYGCDAGYMPVGNGTITCQSEGTWTDLELVCVYETCGLPPDVANGSFKVYTRNRLYVDLIPFRAIYSCNAGHVLSGNSIVTCDSNDDGWTGTPPTCTFVDCGIPLNLKYGQFAYNETYYGSVAVIECDASNELSEHSTISCNTEGEWIGNVSCPLPLCETPSTPVKGDVFFSSLEINATASFTCQDGYVLNGAMNRTCLDNLQWSFIEPTCVIVDCGILLNPDNGSVNLTSGTTFQQDASYSCDIGFTLVGSDKRVCLEDGTWNESEPVCQLVDCGLPPALHNGSYSSSSGTVYLSQLVYSCNIGFTISRNDTIVCSHTGVWNGTMPRCTAVDCGPVTAPDNGEVVFPGGDVIATTSSKPNLKPLYIMPCLCNPHKAFAGLTQDEIIEQLVRNTSVEKKNTSAFLNKYISREDNRPVSVTTGFASVCVISTMLAVIVCSDIRNFVRHMNNYGSIFVRSRKNKNK